MCRGLFIFYKNLVLKLHTAACQRAFYAYPPSVFTVHRRQPTETPNIILSEIFMKGKSCCIAWAKWQLISIFERQFLWHTRSVKFGVCSNRLGRSNEWQEQVALWDAYDLDFLLKRDRLWKVCKFFGFCCTDFNHYFFFHCVSATQWRCR